MKNKDKLQQLFIRNKGYLYSSELERKSVLYEQLKQLVESKIVEKIKPGLYRHIEIASSDEWLEVCHMYPHGVLCLFSAWSYYQLTTHVPSRYHLAVPNKVKIKLNPYPPVQLYYWTESYYIIDVEQKNGIQIYGLEKSVCDAIRFKSKVGVEITSEVVKNYLKRKDKNLNKLIQTAKRMKIENQVRNTLEMLV